MKKSSFNTHKDPSHGYYYDFAYEKTEPSRVKKLCQGNKFQNLKSDSHAVKHQQYCLLCVTVLKLLIKQG